MVAGPRARARRRGVTLLHELSAHGANVAVASDNTRDQYYEFGDMVRLYLPYKRRAGIRV